ncbi:MAG: hypothetical protein D6748_15915 [Calditrichaeota bacterium]|nr:MAG: hypothetical protein D6748_15915 [Calditrichota bacterium]
MKVQRLMFWMLLIFFTSGTVQWVYAIPAFARKYKMSCNTCHAPIPKLKPFGEEFAANGFVMKGQEPSRATINTGDDMLLLQRTLPVALRLDAYMQFKPDNDVEEVQSDLQTPYILKILSGGRVSKNVSYYFYFFFSERGEVAGIEDAYIFFNDLFGTPLDVAVGQFQVSDPLFKRELRLTFEDYQIYRTHVGIVPSNLTYDRGVMISYTTPWGSDLFAEIINGNGKKPADEARQFDNDSFKNFALRWTHTFSALRVGAFGYYGKTEELKSMEQNQMLQYGPDATLTLGPLEINAQYLWRTDDNPFYKAQKPDEKIKTEGGLVEVIYAPDGDRSKWYLIGLYNRVDSDIAEKIAGATPLDYESIGLTGTYLLARNLRVMAEYNYNIETEKNRFTIGFVSAF